jgi:hypothetical protein
MGATISFAAGDTSLIAGGLSFAVVEDEMVGVVVVAEDDVVGDGVEVTRLILEEATVIFLVSLPSM